MWGSKTAESFLIFPESSDKFRWIQATSFLATVSKSFVWFTTLKQVDWSNQSWHSAPSWAKEVSVYKDIL